MFRVHFAMVLLAIFVGIRPELQTVAAAMGFPSLSLKAGIPLVLLDTLWVTVTARLSGIFIGTIRSLSHEKDLREGVEARERMRGRALYFCFCRTNLSTVNRDTNGTAPIGKYLLYHRFMIPGIIAVGCATVVGWNSGLYS